MSTANDVDSNGDNDNVAHDDDDGNDGNDGHDDNDDDGDVHVCDEETGNPNLKQT